MDEKKNVIVQQIIQLVGGAENIINIWHCMTRLRFDLKNLDMIQEEEIKKLNGVMGTQFTKKQFQVVLGTTVNQYYEIACEILGISANDVNTPEDITKEKKDFVTWFMDMVSGVFGPIVPAIAGAGMIKGLISGLAALGIISNTTDTYLLIDILASGVFTFLPFFIAVSAAKKFKTSPFLALSMAATIMFPALVDTAKSGEVSQFTFGGIIPVPVFNYSGSVIPIIFSVLALSYIHKIVDKHMPDVLKTVVTPTLTILISGFFTLTVIGPIGIHLGNGLAWIIDRLFDISPVVAGIVFGAIRPVSILVGMHHAMTPIALQNFADKGYDMLMPMMFIANLSIVGAAAACYFKEKTREGKSAVVSSVISGALGITEPALFGILTKYKKALIAVTISSSLSSAFISAFGVRLYGYILSSVFSIPAYIGPYFPFAAIGWLLALVISFSLTWVFVVQEKESKELVAILNGKVIPITEVADETFSSKSLGDGVAFEPENENTVVAPAGGEVVVASQEMKHACGIKLDNGVEILIHVGIDTVAMNGEGFELLVKQGQKVKKGTPLIRFDKQKIVKAGYKATTMLIVTDDGGMKNVEYHTGVMTQKGKTIVAKFI